MILYEIIFNILRFYWIPKLINNLMFIEILNLKQKKIILIK